ncbi:SpoIIE family protein phosphatase [Desulfonema magnum]|uniref:PPM-type phosphatase domain-containing protein n=1 Tax=Desulfonema magnum TaxID=45655 RepID=A0A975GRH9_9BACT|nr:SpoIIE family protein phosphatase [Desulfonema magnum]QTA91076.1 PPM-type phosphatase domain-containing protein [Desulfonema magnum]
MSLRTKLLVLSIILALIPLGISGRSMIQMTRDELKSSAQDHLIAVANDITRDIEDDFYHTWLGPLQLIRKSVENEYLGAKEKLSLLTEGMKSISGLVALQISVEGIEHPLFVTQEKFSTRLKKASLDPARTLMLTSGQIAALQKQKAVFAGGLTYLREADAWLMTVILGLDERTFGRPATLSARLNLERIKKRIENHSFIKTKTDAIILIESDGRKIFDPSRTDISQYSIAAAAKDRWHADTDTIGTQLYIGPDKKKMLGAYAFPSLKPFVETPLLSVIVEKSETDAYLAVRQMEQRLLLWIVIGFSFAVAGAVIVSVSLTRPLRRLTRGARIISQGDLSVRIETKGHKDEIGELSLAFNKMVKDLRQHMKELEETTKAKERAESELKLAKDIQESFLPKKFPELEEIEVWGKCDPAREVGGDYFDFFQIDDDHYGMVIGDVSGKGVPAALFMAASRTLFRTLISQEHLPDKVLTEFNDRLVALDQGSNMFITLFYGVLNKKSGHLVYSTAGHNMPYVKSSQDTDGIFQMLPGMKTMIAGMMDGMEMGRAEIDLHKGDAIVLYTDGMTEAINRNDEEFGEERLEQLLDKYADMSAREMCKRLIADVKAFQTGMPQFDDMTMLILKVK